MDKQTQKTFECPWWIINGAHYLFAGVQLAVVSVAAIGLFSAYHNLTNCELPNPTYAVEDTL